jgi:hypothetical protein
MTMGLKLELDVLPNVYCFPISFHLQGFLKEPTYGLASEDDSSASLQRLERDGRTSWRGNVVQQDVGA